jgi:hypothetical protein
MNWDLTQNPHEEYRSVYFLTEALSTVVHFLFVINNFFEPNVASARPAIVFGCLFLFNN